MRVLAPIAVVVALAAPARAEPQGSIALLPLDSDPKLEIYSQPVASEIASRLVAGGIDVVVVGPKMAVPERARLVVDGTIKAGRDNSVTLALRIRDPREGVTVDTLVVTAPSLDAMDRARDELTAKVLPSIRGRLATMDKPAPKPPVEPPPAGSPAPPPLRPVLVAVTTTDNNAAPLRDELAAALEPWALRHHHDAKVTDMRQIASKAAPKAVATASADLSVWLEVKAFEVEHDGVPLATARVHVIVADPTKVVFDRVIATDTIVGEKALAPDLLIRRVAREVVDILEPHVRRLVPEWH